MIEPLSPLETISEYRSEACLLKESEATGSSQSTSGRHPYVDRELPVRTELKAAD
jgi:hypothetical protein